MAQTRAGPNRGTVRVKIWGRMPRWMPYLLVGLGSLTGGSARYFITRLIGTAGHLPLATLLVNVSGSFVLGLLAGLISLKSPAHADALRLALGVGFCGGFTTFSTFALENVSLLDDGRWPAALAYTAVSLVLGLLAVRLGLLAARVF